MRPEQKEALRKEMARLGIREQDLIEKFIKSGRKGCQKMNNASVKLRCHLNSPGFAKRLLKIILEAASRSGIPGSLYFRSQQNLADHISSLLESPETAWQIH